MKEMFNTILAALKALPTWVWIVAVACIILPTIAFLFKKAFKVVLLLCIVAVAILVFPSVGNAISDVTRLKYDSEGNLIDQDEGKVILPNWQVQRINDSTLSNGVKDALKQINLDKITDKELRDEIKDRTGEVLNSNEIKKIKNMLGLD